MSIQPTELHVQYIAVILVEYRGWLLRLDLSIVNCHSESDEVLPSLVSVMLECYCLVVVWTSFTVFTTLDFYLFQDFSLLCPT